MFLFSLNSPDLDEKPVCAGSAVLRDRLSNPSASRRWRFRVACLVSILIPSILSASLSESEALAWRAAVELRFNDSRKILVGAQPHSPTVAESERLRFASAVVALNAQPKTRANIDEAQATFTDLARHSSDHELVVQSRYYLGRVAQVHLYAPDLGLAEKIYTQLIHDFPQHPYAQMGVVKLAALKVYGSETTASAIANYRALARYDSLLSFAPAVRDFNLLMGVIALDLSIDRPEALRRLLAAEKCGITQDKTYANLLMRIAETANETGANDLAREYYTKFVAHYPEEFRTYLAKQRIMELSTSP